jgi:beta-glucosidase
VLLKNDGLLPLAPTGRVALIGPFAEDRANMLGTWSVSGDSREVRPLHEALATRDGLEVRTAMGANVVAEPWLVERLNVHGTTIRLDPRPARAMIEEAVALARASDVAILALGEAKEHAGESSSRLIADLPEPQRRLAAAVAGAGTPVAAVVFAGRPLALGDLPDRVGALLYAWHGGTCGPDGVADLLTGDAEPTGRLAVTLPAAPGETPLHHSQEPTGRPSPGRFAKFRTGWLDLPDEAARFPFGFGLTHGNVRYRAPEASGPQGGTLAITVPVENRGPRPATETVQLYLSDPVARITRPARALLDFRRIVLARGESQRVRFAVTRDALAYWLAPSLAAAERVWDPGAFVFHAGPNSRDTQSVEVEWPA